MADILTYTAIAEAAASGNGLLGSATSLAAGATTTTIVGSTGKTPFVSGFIITGLGATGASAVAVTLTGLIPNVTLNFSFGVPAGVGVAALPLIVVFPQAMPGAVAGTITLTVPTFGAGNVAASSTLFGFQV